MRAQQLHWQSGNGWSQNLPNDDADLILYFGARRSLADGARYHELRRMFPTANIIGCSTGGQIHDNDVEDETIVALAVHFDATTLRVVNQPVPSIGDSRGCGEAIGRALAHKEIAGIFILSDGLNVNGSELVKGISDAVGCQVPLTGGLAGDGVEFDQTLVGANGVPSTHAIAAVGFYGKAIRFGHGSAGGWDTFGPQRRINRSNGNVLLELDGEPALDLYERYLGEDGLKGLPGTALLFPLQISDPERPGHEVVRTVLAVDRTARSMTFAGDMPEGWTAQLMRGNFDHLTAGARHAARQARLKAVTGNDSVAILVSCIGRRLLMGQRVSDEIEAAATELGPQTLQLGFYSYGEISPDVPFGASELHNQTMTVTTLNEAVW